MRLGITLAAAALVSEGSGLNLGLLGFSFDPEPLGNLTTDSHFGKQTTYDVTNQTTIDELKSVLPGIFEPSKLYKSSESPGTYTIAYARLVSKFSRLTSLRHNAMVSLKDDIKEGLYQFRFAQVPGDERSGPQNLAVGLSSIDTFASGWSAKSILLGTEGNLQAKGAVATGFTDRWGVSDIVDWFVEVRESTVDVFVAINGKPYGHAFHLDFGMTPEVISMLRPMISFSESSDKSAVIAVAFKPASIPKAASYRQHYPPEKTDGVITTSPQIVGNWVSAEGVRIAIRSSGDSATSQSVRLNAKIINTINMSMNVENGSGLILNKSVPVSTMMAGPAEKMVLENKFGTILRCVNQATTSSDGNTLTLACINSDAKQSMSFTRYFPNPVQPANYNPFVADN